MAYRLTLLYFSFLLIVFCSTTSAQTFRSVDAAIGNPKEVIILDLSGKGLTQFPQHVLKCKNLEELNLSPEQVVRFGGTSPQIINANAIQRIPNEISKLKNLRSLNLQATELVELPFSMINLEKLSFLDLSFNPALNMEMVLLIIPKLTSLKFIDLSGCSFADKDIQQLKEKAPTLVVQY